MRADLMLTVLYDMLGQYDESDEYLTAAFNVRRGGGGRGCLIPYGFVCDSPNDDINMMMSLGCITSTCWLFFSG